MKLSTLSVVCLAMLAPSAMAVGDKEAEALLARMRQVYSGIKTASIEVVTDQSGAKPQVPQSSPQTPAPRGPGGQPNTLLFTDLIISKMLFAAPYDVSIKCSMNGFAFLQTTCDGKQIAYTRRDGIVNKTMATFQNLDNLLPLNLETMCFFDWRRQLSTDRGMNMAQSTFRITKAVPWNGKKWTMLEETAKLQAVIVRYWIDPATALIWRASTSRIGQPKAYQDCRIISMKLNPKIPAAAFAIPKSQFIRI